MKPRSVSLVIGLVLIFFLSGCETYNATPDQLRKLTEEAVLEAFPWSRECKNQERYGLEIGTETEPYDDYFFKNSRETWAQVPCTPYDVFFIFEPDGTKHFSVSFPFAEGLFIEAKNRNSINQVDLNMSLLEVADHGIALFNRLLTFEEFQLTHDNALTWAKELLRMAHFVPQIAVDGQAYPDTLPPGFPDENGHSTYDAEEVIQVKPMTVRLDNGLYKVHFFSYGGDIKEWNITAKPDGSVVNYKFEYPYGVYWDVMGEVVP